MANKKYLTEERFNAFLIEDFVPMKANVSNIAEYIADLKQCVSKVNGTAREDEKKQAYSDGKHEGRWSLLTILIPASITLAGIIIGLIVSLV